MPDGDVYEATCEMTFNNQEIVNGYHFVQVGADGSGDPRQAVGLVWIGFFEGPLLDVISDEVTVNVVRTRRVLPTQTQSFITTIGTAGTIIGNPLPTNEVAVLRLYGTLAGRKGIGNIRLPGVDAAFVNEGQVNASYVALAELLGDSFEEDQEDVPSDYKFRSCVLGTDSVPRKVQRALMTSRIKQLRSRTIGQGD